MAIRYGVCDIEGGEMKRDRLYLECECHSVEHNMRFSYIADDETPQLFVDVPLCRRPKWYKRIWLGIAYIFGHRSRYGHFDEFIYDPDEVEQLRQFIVKFQGLVEKAKTHG